jgi:hypothetical protein
MSLAGPDGVKNMGPEDLSALKLGYRVQGTRYREEKLKYIFFILVPYTFSLIPYTYIAVLLKIML